MDLRGIRRDRAKRAADDAFRLHFHGFFAAARLQTRAALEPRPLLWTSVAAAALTGAFAASGAYTFVFANGIDYLSNDPAACANCHVMRAQLDGWSRSSHHAAAVCNDCHLPQASPAGKLVGTGRHGG